jgi:hypothetical protein
MSQAKVQRVWCRACEQYVAPDDRGEPRMYHRARCGLTCDRHGVAKFFSEHTPVPGTLLRHFSMVECQKRGESGACPKKRRKPKEER